MIEVVSYLVCAVVVCAIFYGAIKAYLIEKEDAAPEVSNGDFVAPEASEFVWAHGFNFWFSKDIDLQRKISAFTENNTEICCAEVALGSCGVLLKGEVTGLFKSDCFSYLDNSGNRVSKKGVKTDASIVDVEAFRTQRHSGEMPFAYGIYDSGKYYREVFVRNYSVVAVFINKDASADVVKLMNAYAQSLGVEVFITK